MARLLELVKKIIGFGLVAAFIVIAAIISGWSPLNLIFGPQYDGTPSSVLSPLVSWMFDTKQDAPVVQSQDSRDRFKKEILPRMYPQLILHLERTKRFEVEWISQSGEKQKQTIYLGPKDDIIVETDIYVGTQEEIASQSSKQNHVTMIDSDKDGKLNLIEYLRPTGQRDSFQNPTDEASLFLWDAALAITFKFSSCCR